MRAHGVLNGPDDITLADHVCWAYADAESFAQAAIRFLQAGLDRGDRLLWVGDGAECLRGAPGRLAAVEDLVGRGSLELLSLADAYRGTGSFSPESQLEFYGGATRRALDDGYRGLRLVAEATGLAADPASLAVLLRWEPVADDYIASGHPLSALCAYHAGRLPAAVVRALASVHPSNHLVDEEGCCCAFFDDGAISLAGDLDTFAAEHLGRALAGMPVTGPVVRLDLSGLDFVDLAGCRVVAGWARTLADRPARLEVTGASRLLRQMWTLLGYAAELGHVTFPDARP